MPGGRPPRCRICATPALKDYIDAGLTKGLSASGLAAGVEAMGGNIQPETISRHKARHWVMPTREGAPTPTKRDLAIMVREKVADAVEPMTGEAMLLFGKDMAPAINAGLKAQAMLDKREAVNKKLGIAAGALSLQMWLAGLNEAPPPPELDDGNTIEGEAVEVES